MQPLHLVATYSCIHNLFIPAETRGRGCSFPAGSPQQYLTVCFERVHGLGQMPKLLKLPCGCFQSLPYSCVLFQIEFRPSNSPRKSLTDSPRSKMLKCVSATFSPFNQSQRDLWSQENSKTFSPLSKKHLIGKGFYEEREQDTFPAVLHPDRLLSEQNILCGSNFPLKPDPIIRRTNNILGLIPSISFAFEQGKELCNAKTVSFSYRLTCYVHSRSATYLIATVWMAEEWCRLSAKIS